MKKRKEITEVLEGFLDYIDECRSGYQTARDTVGLEDRRLQDLLHEPEFSGSENEKRRSGTRLQQSRRERRRQTEEGGGVSAGEKDVLPKGAGADGSKIMKPIPLPPGKETKRETVRRLRAEGLTVWEIVRETGMNPNTAGTYYREWNRLDPAGGPKEPMGVGMNADRHLCRSCQYRARKEAVNGCDYCWITEKSRRCKWADCDKYVKGPRLKARNAGKWS